MSLLTSERSLQVLLFAVLLCLIAGTVRLRFNRPLESEVAEKQFWAKKVTAAPEYDIVVMGDSRIYRGVSPAAIESVLDGYRVLNFGYSLVGYSPEMFAAAESKLNAESEQRIVILGVTPHSLTLYSYNNYHFFQEWSRPIDQLVQYKTIPADLLRFFEPFPKSEIRNHFRSESEINFYHQEWFDNGWAASYYDRSNPSAHIDSTRGRFFDNPVTQRSIDTLLNQTAAWLSDGVKVYAFRPPTTEAMVAVEQELSGFDQAAFVESFEGAGGKWIPLPDYEGYESYDGSHLHRDSAEKLSLEIAKFINNSLEK